MGPLGWGEISQTSHCLPWRGWQGWSLNLLKPWLCHRKVDWGHLWGCGCSVLCLIPCNPLDHSRPLPPPPPPPVSRAQPITALQRGPDVWEFWGKIGTICWGAQRQSRTQMNGWSPYQHHLLWPQTSNRRKPLNLVLPNLVQLERPKIRSQVFPLGKPGPPGTHSASGRAGGPQPTTICLAVIWCSQVMEKSDLRSVLALMTVAVFPWSRDPYLWSLQPASNTQSQWWKPDLPNSGL